MSVENFRTNFQGGTRKNRFRVTGSTPSGLGLPVTFNDFHVEATSFPASILTENPIDYQGRKIYYPGDRIYGENGFNLWTVSFLDDSNSGSQGSVATSYWKGLHNWHNKLNDHVGNTSDNANPNLLVSDLNVEQLNLNDTEAIKTITLHDCWPQSVGKIEFQMQARDQYARFDVTFCFKYVTYGEMS